MAGKQISLRPGTSAGQRAQDDEPFVVPRRTIRRSNIGGTEILNEIVQETVFNLLQNQRGRGRGRNNRGRRLLPPNTTNSREIRTQNSENQATDRQRNTNSRPTREIDFSKLRDVKDNLTTGKVYSFGSIELDIFKSDFKFKTQEVINEVQQSICDNLWYAAKTHETKWTLAALNALTHYWQDDSACCYVVADGPLKGIYLSEKEIHSTPEQIDCFYKPCKTIFEAIAMIEGTDYYLSPHINYISHLPQDYEDYLHRRERHYVAAINELLAILRGFDSFDNPDVSMLEDPTVKQILNNLDVKLASVKPRGQKSTTKATIIEVASKEAPTTSKDEPSSSKDAPTSSKDALRVSGVRKGEPDSSKEEKSSPLYSSTQKRGIKDYFPAIMKE